MTPRARAVITLLQDAGPYGWFDARHFDDVVRQTWGDGADARDAGALAGWCTFVDFAPVWQRVREAAAEVLVPALVEARAIWTGPPPPADVGLQPRPDALSAIEAALREGLCAAPATAAALDGDARRRAEAWLDEAGVALPPFAGWRSPWASKRTSRKAAPLRLPAWPARCHAPPSPVPDDEARDEALERQWAGRQYRATWELRGMGDRRALPLWQALDVAAVWCRDDLVSLSARFGLPGLETTLRGVRRYPSELAALGPFEAPAAAPLIAAGLSSPRATLQQLAREWLTRFPEAAVVGLAEEALDGTKAGAPARHALRTLRRLSPAGWARAVALLHPDDALALEEALAAAPSLPARRPALPASVSPDRVPRLRTVDGAAALQGEALAELLQLLKATPLEGGPWLDELRATFSAQALALLARALLEGWLLNGAAPKERWMLHAAAHFGDEALAQHLATLAAALAPRGLSSRAQEMVEVLAAMGTRASLALVHQLSRRSRSKAFRARAELAFVTAAERMGLTGDELAERLVPDFGLRPDGTLPLPAPVRLEVVKGKARFVDAEGAVVKAFPPTGDEERDAELAEAKKRVPALVRDALERLEARMAAQRRMSVEHFTEAYAMHGVLAAAARNVVWSAWQGDQLVASFRLTPTGLVDTAGRAVSLPLDAQVGVAHALALEPAERLRWRQALGPQPFAQLERPTYDFAELRAFEAAARRFDGASVPTARLLALEKRGWVRGEPVGGGCYVDLTCTLTTLRLRLEFEPGIYLGEPLANPTQLLHLLVVEPRAAQPSPVELSEAFLALTSLTAPA